MPDDITKLCADSLRAFIQDKYSVKLRSAHAHELVAAFFGYKSKIALLSDNRYPISNLRQAEFILLNPSISLVEQRRQNLEGLSPGLPQSHILAEGVYSALVAERWILDKIQPTFRDLAISLADKHAQRLTWNRYPAPVREDVKVESADDAMRLTVSRFYPQSSTKPIAGVASDKRVDTIIQLPRMAANLGYGKPEISRNINVDSKLEVQL